MVARSYVPGAGDLVWLTFDSQAGHEPAWATVRTDRVTSRLHAKARLAIACPITSHAKGYPFEVALPDNGKVTGVVLADHVKNLDWNARRVEFVATAPVEVLTDVRERLRVLLGL